MTYLLETNAISVLMRSGAQIQGWLSQIQDDDSCCDLDIEIAPATTQILVPYKKFESVEPPRDMSAPFCSSPANVRITLTDRLVPPFQPAVTIPLLT